LRRLRIALATGAVTAAMAHVAAAADPATITTTAETPPPPTTTTTTPTPPPATGVTVTPTPIPAPIPKPPKPSGQGKGNQGSSGANQPGGSKHGGKKNGKAGKRQKKNSKNQSSTGATTAPNASALNLGAPVYPSVSCGTSPGAPAALLPIYQGASDAYGLGPEGPGVLAAINGIESGFGVNLGPSSAGAVGWMQFLPSTWAVYGVDANGDGKADPNNPQDAIYAAASYLRAAGMPLDTPGAIFSYNHADWYVAEVLANAGCYGTLGGAFSLTSGKQVISCNPAKDVSIPEPYMQAFEQAASQYDLGMRGVWALAGVARLESNFGRDMTAEQLITAGPLGMDRNEWNRFEVDGDGDGRIEHADIYDAAATMAREIWSRGDLRAGLFLHNQAEWYVQEVLSQANQISGNCTTGAATWTVALPNTPSALLVANSQMTVWSTTMFEGVRVCSYMVPILQAARSLGWQGQVLSGYRTFAEQASIHASGIFSAAPGESNHEGCAGLTYGPGNGAVDVSDPANFGAAMARLGDPLRNVLGGVDPGHFSPGGN
jgi:hypothetical protein